MRAMGVPERVEDVAALRACVEQLTATNEELLRNVEKLSAEREQYRTLYLKMLKQCKRLERGLLGRKAERLTPGHAQLTLQLLGTLLAENEAAPPPEEEEVAQPVHAHTRRKPSGRRPLPESLPHVDIEVVPEEVQRQGLDAFERIGEDVSEVVERRPASMVVVRTHKPKFVRKDRERLAETEVLVELVVDFAETRDRGQETRDTKRPVMGLPVSCYVSPVSALCAAGAEEGFDRQHVADVD